MPQYLLSILIFLPLLFVPFVLWISKTKVQQRITAIAFSLQTLISLYALHLHNTSAQLVEKAAWIRFTNAQGEILLATDYVIAIDGLNILFAILTAFIMLVGTVASTQANIAKQTKGYFALLLLLGTSIMGCFLAQDFFLFYLFFEFMLFPMYFLVGIWGGKRREYAAIKFFLYTLLGSIFILIGMIALYASAMNPEATQELAGFSSVEETQQALQQNQIDADKLVKTFQFQYLENTNNYAPTSWLGRDNTLSLWGISLRNWIFLALLVGFAIKLPIMPVHTWLPDAHVEAPTPISVILAGLLLKVGGYGILRIVYPIFPDAAHEFATLLGVLGMVTIIYAAFVALGTQHLKKMIAYSSVSHMGFVLLGIAALTNEGVNGAIFQMLSHGIISPMLFLIAGVLYQRTRNLEMENYKGLAQQMPLYTGFTTIAFFASLGLPGFSGFIAELLVFLGAFKSDVLPAWIAIISTLGLLLGAGYYLWTLQRMFMGNFSLKFDEWKNQLTALTVREKVLLFSLAAITFILGIFPSLILDITSPFTAEFLQKLTERFANLNTIKVN